MITVYDTGMEDLILVAVNYYQEGVRVRGVRGEVGEGCCSQW